jgi:hypothetical protein
MNSNIGVDLLSMKMRPIASAAMDGFGSRFDVVASTKHNCQPQRSAITRRKEKAQQNVNAFVQALWTGCRE